MQKIVVRKDLYDEIMNQQSREARDIGKSNPYPRQDSGRWGCKPDLKVVNNLKPKLLKELKVMNNKQFSNEVEKLYKGNTFDFPDVIRLPNLNKMLSKKMGLNNPNCYFTKKQFIHSRPQRKGSYNQALRIEEFKRIPEIIHSSNVLFWDKRLKNFFIPFYDMENKDKFNKICFYKDQNGNFAITVSKINLSNLNNNDYKKVGVGVAPTIHKSLPIYPASALLASPTYNLIIQDVSNMSIIKSFKPDYNGADMLHKSFDITVADITENNKQKKIEQVEKALTAVYQKQPFAIRHIKSDSDSTRYDDIILRIRDFDRDKIQKAVHKIALTLDTKIKSAKGEAFTYKAQEELTDRIIGELTEKTKSLYSFLISFLGLPEVRIVSKANLTYKGKILYDPESGKPISKAEWKKFTAELEKFLNRNYSGTGERIVLSAESLGRILERLSKTNSFEALKKMRLSGLKYGGKTFDWISDDIRNMQNTLGESIDRMTQARIQVAVDSAAQRITKVTDAIRNDIQQTIIDGIRERQSRTKISQNLFDKCSGLNRDFQRIADTEIQNNTNNAYIKEEVYNTPDEKVYFKRFEMKDGNTCKKCLAIAGKIALFSDIPLDSERIKDPYADYAIWEGKTDGVMPMGTVHPYCRGSWYRYYPEIK